MLQLIFSAVIFLSTLLFTLLPSRLLPRDSRVVVSHRVLQAVSLCNCLSGGIFLGTCNLQMVPYIERRFRKVLETTHMSEDMSCRLTQLILLVGFFLVLLIDILVHLCQKHRATKTDYAAVVDSDVDVAVTTQEDAELLQSQTVEPKSTIASTSANGVQSTIADNGHVRSHASHGHSGSVHDAHSGHGHSESGHGHSESGHGHSESGHGHSHSESGHGHSHLMDIVDDNIGIRCLLLLTALSIHSLFEGLALGLQEDVHQLTNIFIGVLLHEVFVAFAMGISLARQHFRLMSVVKLSLTVSAMIPVGMYVGMTLGIVHSTAGEVTSVLIQGVAAGTFVYVVFVEILPAEMNDSHNKLLKVLFLFIGLVIMTCLSFSLK